MKNYIAVIEFNQHSPKEVLDAASLEIFQKGCSLGTTTRVSIKANSIEEAEVILKDLRGIVGVYRIYGLLDIGTDNKPSSIT